MTIVSIASLGLAQAPTLLPHHLNSSTCDLASVNMSTPPAKRKNMAVTTDGAQYNKRQRPDNYAAMMAMPPLAPPPSRRPNVSNPATANNNEEDKETAGEEKKKKDIPTHTQKTDWWKWTKDGPGGNATTRDDSNRGVANGTKPQKAVQVETSEVEDEPVVKTDVQNANDESAHDDGSDNEKGDDDASQSEAPGSPVDAPETHFAAFTPMGAKKVIWKKPKGGEQNDDEPKGKKNKKNNQRDLRYGQASALNLDDVTSDDGEGAEAMRYLKGVRCVHIPFVLETAHVDLPGDLHSSPATTNEHFLLL